MSNLQGAVRAFATPSAEPSDVCTSVNRLLCGNIATGKFVTFCYAVIDTAAQTLVYANAGHNHPILCHADGSVERLTTTGLVLGVAPEWHYTSGDLAFGPGDQLVCFTDGITEAASIEDEEFGDQRLVELIQTHRSETASGLSQRVLGAVQAWTGGSPQDDATLIVVHFV
jgi:sigma-B regulation protein RsbU (phosphoserine phosphatase)